MNHRSLHVITVISLISTCAVFGQGSLTPPTGPPGPTMKTLQQIEPRTPISSLPFTISQPGSYYVTTNLINGAGDGISIEANGVTLDLTGFELVGGGSGVGISVWGNRTNIAIRNGTVRGWFQGVRADTARNCHFERLLVTHNQRDGIWTGEGSMIVACTSSYNGGNGIRANNYSTVNDCVTIRNGNGGSGIHVTNSCFVLNNQCVANGSELSGGAGIWVTGGSSRIEANNVTSNNNGIVVVSTNNLIIRNSATGSRFSNYGIVPGNKVGTITSDPAIAGAWANFEW